MEDGKKLDPLAESSIPSAPPPPVAVAEGLEDPLSNPTPLKSPLSRDVHLVNDLLRKADGDAYRVASWLEIMGEAVTAEELRSKVAQNPTRGVERYGDDMDTAAAQLGAPDTYFCPISFHLLRDPVLLQTGQTYERSAIQRWLAEGGSICPVTGIELPRPVVLSPNVALRQAIEDWALKNANWMLGQDGKLLPVPEKEKKHFSVEQQAAVSDGDTALAIVLQEAELNRQGRGVANPGGRQQTTQTRSHPTSVSDAKRVRRCVHILFLVTVLHFGMFLITLSKGDWEFEKIDANPLVGFSARVINRVGGTDTSLISDHNEWWRVLTSSLMTAGIIHLQWVISCLWTFGRFLSTKMSFLSLSLLYIVSCVSGVLLSANMSTVYVSAGASAGSFGLIGAVLIEISVNRKDYRSFPVSFIFLCLMAGVGVVMGLTPMVDNWTNLGGFISGIITATALRLTHRGHRHQATCCLEFGMVIIQVALFFLMALLLTIGCVGLFLNIDQREDCSWCRKLACVSTSWWNCDVARILPNDCAFDVRGDLQTKITCPNGDSKVVQLLEVSDQTLDQQCEEVCDLRRGSLPNGLEQPVTNPQTPSPSSIPSGRIGGDGRGNIVRLPASPEDSAIAALTNGNTRTNKTE